MATFDKLRTRLVDELAEKAAEISEMKRQLDKVYKRLTEVGIPRIRCQTLSGFSKMSKELRARQGPPKLLRRRQSMS